MPNLNVNAIQPEGVSKDSYGKKYDRNKDKTKTWRMKIWIALVIIILTILSMIEGIVAIIYTAVALGDESGKTDEDSEY